MRALVLVVAASFVAACGGGGGDNKAQQPSSQGRKTVLVYEDPAFLDGTPIPGDAIVRKVFCGATPDQFTEVALPGRRTALAYVVEQAALPYNATVYCVGTAEVDGISGAPSQQVQFYCNRAGPNVICFGR